ncbi:MAG: aldehyde ferredoxin oxidoreductase family protein [Thermoproteota archaeon]
MFEMKGGYTGRVLCFDLSLKKARVDSLSEKEAFLMLGGKGLGALCLYRSLRGKEDPLSPENPLIVSTGPLTGTIAPTGTKFSIVTKSPQTGVFLDSNCGGMFGVQLKRAGYDMLIIKGSAEAPSVLVVDENGAELRPSKLWGRTTFETIVELRKEFPVHSFLIVGPAGERLAPISGLMTDDMRSAGRGGSGAVMGSKRLKAIVVCGKRPIEVYDPDGLKRAAWVVRRMLRLHEVTARSLPRHGTVNIIEAVNEMGALPTRNFQKGRFEGASELSGEKWRSGLWRADKGCYGCTIRCGKIAVLNGKWVDGPDYETIWAFGPNCGIKNAKTIAMANYLCDAYGLDTISTGVTISFLMELYEKGFIRELDGLKPTWGDEQVFLRLVEKACKGEECGRMVEQGVARLSRKFPGSESFAMHVKGLEIPAYEPRAAKGMGLGYATSDRGACHLRGYTAGQELLGYGGGVDPYTIEGKARLVIDRQDEKAVIDSSGLCFFAFYAITLKELHRMVVACTGQPYKDWYDFMRIGERVYNLTRLFNVREGLTRKDDSLPRRFLNEPMTEGPGKGQVVELEPMLSEYYRLRGWDEKGEPKKETLDRLGLKELLRSNE